MKPPRRALWLAFGTALALYVSMLALPAATRYVWQDSPGPAVPYTDWASAAHTIQTAVDAAQAGDTVLVTNGVYATGGRAVFGLMTNRLAVTKALTIVSVNGPVVTVIAGAASPGAGNGNGAIRCAYVGTNTVLSGFTLTNGHTRSAGDLGKEQSGGGAWCEPAGLVTNCVLAGNAASFQGGGAYCGSFGSRLKNCLLTGNAALYGGGALSGTFDNCTLSNNAAENGGGVFVGLLNNCTVSSNSATGVGGGVYSGTLNNCTLNGNSAMTSAGGAFSSMLTNCLLTGNLAVFGAGAERGTLVNCTLSGNSANSGGGADFATLINCIAFYNTGSSNANHYDCFFSYSCTTPLPLLFASANNITNEPGFVNRAMGNLRLQPNSPCIDAGLTAAASSTNDLDGRARIVNGRVDIGAYEFQGPGMGQFIAWLQRFGQATDGSADYTDPDRDGLNNWQEWVADTNPTNAWSLLRVEGITLGPPVAVRFSSSADRRYSLKFSTNPTARVWLDVPGQTNVAGRGGPQSLVDTNGLPGFYRVSVSFP